MQNILKHQNMFLELILNFFPQNYSILYLLICISKKDKKKHGFSFGVHKNCVLHFWGGQKDADNRHVHNY